MIGKRRFGFINDIVKKEILNIANWYSVLFVIIVGSFLSYFYGGYGLSVALLITEIINFFLCKYFINKNEIK